MGTRANKDAHVVAKKGAGKAGDGGAGSSGLWPPVAAGTGPRTETPRTAAAEVGCRGRVDRVNASGCEATGSLGVKTGPLALKFLGSRA